MVKAPVKVGCLPLYGMWGPSSRYRLFQFVQPLERAGFHCRLLPAPERKPGKRLAYLPRLLMLALAQDVLFIQKRTFPAWVLNTLRRFNPRLVYDFDDAIFLKPELKQGLDRILTAASSVIAGSTELANYARLRQMRVVEIPTVVDTDRYQPGVNTRRGSTAQVVLGWIGSDPNFGSLEMLVPVFEWLVQRYGDKILLRIIGSRAWKTATEIRQDFIPWSLETSIHHLQTFDIGLMPLEDTPWNRGKCGLKLVEYAAAGIPAVASPVGANASILLHGESGLAVRSAEEWQDAISLLIDQPALRSKMGQTARVHAQAHYSLSTALPRLANVLQHAAQGERQSS
jgi:glycosyltransferase involved in cell wall biosynthesis